MFPDAIQSVLERFGVTAETRAALYDLYLAFGSAAVDAFATIAEREGGADRVRPDQLGAIREIAIDRYLSRYHGDWLGGQPTPSFWHPRAAEGRASGLLVPCGRIGSGDRSALGARIEGAVRSIVGIDQPVPAGILIHGKNAHFGGRAEVISFDVVPEGIDDARALSVAEGRQHTVPGSAGETSGTIDEGRGAALIWEIQPNVLKPSGERNRGVAAILRRHRNWHVTTFAFALLWLADRRAATWIVRGEALGPTHQVNPAEPISDAIAAHHDRTVRSVVHGIGGTLVEPDAGDERTLLESDLPNKGLRRFIEKNGAGAAVWRIMGVPDANRVDASGVLHPQ